MRKKVTRKRGSMTITSFEDGPAEPHHYQKECGKMLEEAEDFTRIT